MFRGRFELELALNCVFHGVNAWWGGHNVARWERGDLWVGTPDGASLPPLGKWKRQTFSSSESAAFPIFREVALGESQWRTVVPSAMIVSIVLGLDQSRVLGYLEGKSTLDSVETLRVEELLTAYRAAVQRVSARALRTRLLASL